MRPCRPGAGISSESASPRFTEKQGQYLAFIHTYVLLNRQSPAEADFQRFFCVTPTSVHQMIIQRNAVRARRVPSCQYEILVPFSCKVRGLCPSCDGRQMAAGAADLVDHILPVVDDYP